MSISQRLPFVPRIVVAVMSAVLLVLVGVSHAIAQTSEPLSTGTLEVSDDVLENPLQLGAAVTVSGSGFAPGAQIDVLIESDPILLATVDADAAGAFEVTVRIPTEGLAPGAHTLKATGPDATGGLRVLSVSVRVAGEPSQEDSGALPVTGGDALSLVVVGSGAVLLGGLLVQWRRRRLSC